MTVLRCRACGTILARGAFRGKVIIRCAAACGIENIYVDAAALADRAASTALPAGEA